MNKQEYQTYLASREWAVKREAVRERSRDRCERCWTNAMDAVHHKTYERIGHEELEDLVAICDPCHEFLSAKRDDDPMTAGVGVYLAGSFSLDWRRELLAAASRRNVTWDGFERVSRGLRGGFDATGPWKISSHYSANTHGVLTGHGDTFCSCCNQSEVVDLCKSAIKSSDIIFAWLPDVATVPAGTLWEMGYAAALEKIVVVARPPSPVPGEWGPDHDPGDYWFPMAAASIDVYAPTAGRAWDMFCAEDWPRLLKQGKLKRQPPRRVRFGMRTAAVV